MRMRAQGKMTVVGAAVLLSISSQFALSIAQGVELTLHVNCVCVLLKTVIIPFRVSKKSREHNGFPKPVNSVYM